ncbi:lipid A core-O-antigen ligase [Vibrio sp. JCM 19236]|nr:lipid A core-O-antigen ligase [Vibrio sp. JCM 19236]
MGLWAGLGLFVALQQFRFSNEEKQRLLWFILLSVLIEAFFGWVQYTLLSEGNIFGYNTVANRPYGIFQQPNVMASFLATGLVISGYLLARQPHTKYLHWRHKLILLYATPVLTIPLLVVLASRTGWLGSILALALLLPYVHRFAARNRAYTWGAMLLLGLGVGLGLTQVGDNQSLLQQKADLESPRAYTFPQTLDMLIEKPLSGYGYGRFEPEYMLYTARQHQLNSEYPAGLPSMDHPHNELLYWGAEGAYCFIRDLSGDGLCTVLANKSEKRYPYRYLVAIYSNRASLTAGISFLSLSHTLDQFYPIDLLGRPAWW